MSSTAGMEKVNQNIITITVLQRGRGEDKGEVYEDEEGIFLYME